MGDRGLAGMKTALLLLIAVVSVGCVKTVQLEPSMVAQDCTSNHNEAKAIYCTSLPKFGLACTGSTGTVSANSLKEFINPVAPPVVGWGDSYDAGTEPFPCWEWVSTFSRGYVKFNLTLVDPESIEYAAISWKTKKLEGDPSKSCVKYLYEATGPWKRGETPATLLHDDLDTTTASAGYKGVVEQAKKWLAKPNENYGLMFEPTRAKTVQNSNSDCTDSLEDLRLTVKYRQKSVKWPGQ